MRSSRTGEIRNVYHLLLHEVDFSCLEHVCNVGPMLILHCRIVEILGGTDEGSKEDSMPSTWHTWNQVSRRMYDRW